MSGPAGAEIALLDAMPLTYGVDVANRQAAKNAKREPSRGFLTHLLGSLLASAGGLAVRNALTDQHCC